MSGPDELTRVKTAVDQYEQEVLENNEIYRKASNIQNAAHLLNSYIRLLDTYRRYVSELEKYVPR
ncbi:MAG: hypothetical protein WCF23_07185 [Candidatus Nitrosopolaris sp.]